MTDWSILNNTMAADFGFSAGACAGLDAHPETQVPKPGLRKQRPYADHQLQV
jgi:hypothetical protein